MTFYRRIVASIAIVAATCPFAALQAADDSLLTVKSSSVGFGGKYKAGYWQPVRVTVAAGAGGARGRLELVIPDGDHAPVIYRDEHAPEINLAQGEETTVLLYGKAGPIAAPLTVQLRRDDQIVWSQRLATGQALLATQELVVGIGPAMGLAEAAATIRRQADLAIQVAELRSATELPDRWWGYEGVNTIALATSDLGLLAAMTAEQRQALSEWVFLGGHLILCVGARGAEIAEDATWSAFLPGKFSEVVPLQERSGLETFTKFELPFDEDSFRRNRPRITRLTDLRGEVLVSEDTGGRYPLVVHATAGMGQVIYVGLDLDHPSLATWQGRTRLAAAILQRDQSPRETGEREHRRTVTHLGYDDLSGQLRTALDQFPGVTTVNFSTVAILIIVYLLLIGPVDFLLLSHFRLPWHLTWLTFPLSAMAAVGLAGYLALQTHGGQVRLNQAEIIDIDLARQQARGTVWTQLYSPSTAHYDPDLEIAASPGMLEVPQGWLSWQGLPGNSLGGLASRQVVLASTEPYLSAMPAQAVKLSGLSVPIASSKSLSARWWARTTLPAHSQLRFDQFGLLSGEFRQPLPVELSDCILAHGEKLYRLGKLRPGEMVSIDAQASLNLEWRLTLRRIEASKDVATPWDQASVDVPRIMQMLMFHEAARGRSYTGLTHRYQPYVDLSQQIRLGQAVLVGRAADAVARLKQNDESLAEPAEMTTWTWYRILLPAEPKSP